MSVTTKSLKIAEDTPQEIRRVDRAIQHLTAASRRRTQALLDNDCIKVNSEVTHQPSRALGIDDVLEVCFDPDQSYEQIKRIPKYLGFDILFEDEHLIVVNKPANWLTIPSPHRETNTLVNRVSEYLTKKNRGKQVMVYPAQRLDRGVSGVLVLGKTLEIAAELRSQFAAHKPERQYVAIVSGRVEGDTGTFRSHLATDEKLNRFSTEDEEEGQEAITHFRCERRWDDASLVRVWLETGRRNQIRVHFAEAGHPILGDQRYETAKARHAKWKALRIALHAIRLAFEHPVTHAACEFETALPEEFSKFLNTPARQAV